MVRMSRLTAFWTVLSLCFSGSIQAQQLKIVVPAYFYPGGEGVKYWQQLNVAAHKVPLWTIINPASGPGERTDPGYTAAVKSLLEAGGKTLAYVDTDYGKRPIDAVLKDVDQWLTLYPGQVNGFFLDQLTNDATPEHLDYLARVYKTIKSKNPKFIVMGNPGTNTLEPYLKQPVCDALMTFENAASEYPAYQPDAWTSRYRPGQFAHILHTTASTETALADAVKSTRQRRAGWIFITDAIYSKEHPNPYDRMPTFWDKEVAMVQRLNLPSKPATGQGKPE